MNEVHWGVKNMLPEWLRRSSSLARIPAILYLRGGLDLDLFCRLSAAIFTSESKPIQTFNMTDIFLSQTSFSYCQRRIISHLLQNKRIISQLLQKGTSTALQIHDHPPQKSIKYLLLTVTCGTGAYKLKSNLGSWVMMFLISTIIVSNLFLDLAHAAKGVTKETLFISPTNTVSKTENKS